MLDHITTKPQNVSSEMWEGWQKFRENIGTYYVDQTGKKRWRLKTGYQFDPETDFPDIFKSSLKKQGINPKSDRDCSDQIAMHKRLAYEDEWGNIVYHHDKLPVTPFVAQPRPHPLKDALDRFTERVGREEEQEGIMI